MIISVPEFGENPVRTARIIPAEPMKGQVEGQVAGQTTGQVNPQVAAVLRVCRKEMNRAELMNALALKGRDNFLKKYLGPALDSGLIEMTQPESPSSPTQKYRLTAEGRTFGASL
jgi:ATP-dependent DNA helicase RecG